ESYGEAVDPYAKAVGVNGKRGMVVDLDSTDPTGWDKNYKREKTNLSDIVVWEVHVRDFSIDVSSGVSDENRGKYKAFTESTTVNGEGKIASCVDYLKEAGVTHVQILPMYDYGGIDETTVTNKLSEDNYNWGYNPENYNAPEGSYSSNPYDGNTRITEMKQMIQALHDAGIKVIMDVVYNHTYATKDSNFNKIMPDYYYKLTQSGKTVLYNDESGCGNATRSGAKMYDKYMRDSLKYWAEEYNLDGFRFDLMGIHDAQTMNNIRADLDATFGEDTIVMYGEGWTGAGYEETSAYKTYARNLDEGIGYFNDQIRDAIKGETSETKAKQIGFVQQNYGVEGLYTDYEKFPTSVFGGIMGSVGKNTSEWWMWRAYWSDTSARVLSYDSCHDNMTLWDKLVQSVGGTDFNATDSQYVEMNRLTAGYLLTAHGGVFLHAGEEFARTKNGEENSYNVGDFVNKLDWTRVGSYADLVTYYHGMIDVRKAFSGFRNVYTETGDLVEENTETGFFNKVNGSNLTEIKEFTNVVGGKNAEDQIQSTVNTIGYYLSNDVKGEWNQVAVLLNNTLEEKTVSLSATDGSTQWVLVSDGLKASVKGVSTTEGNTITVPRKSVVVAVPKKTFDENPIEIKTNTAPYVMGVQDLEVQQGDSVTFTISGKDTDNDVVTLSAANVPEGAKFDPSTGVFLWEKAVAGEYVIDFTANDGTHNKTISMKLRVTSPSMLLEEKIAEIEKAGLVEKEYTATTWSNLQNALTNAKTTLANQTATDMELDTAYLKLAVTYQVVNKERKARAGLTAYIETASAKIAASTTEDFDATLVADAKAVQEEAKALLVSLGTYTAYEAAQENLKDCCDSLISNLENPKVYVKTDVENPYIYSWSDTAQYTGAWPGVALTNKNEEGYYVFELPEKGTYNVIINGTGGQTADITALKEHTYLTIGSTYTVDDKKTVALQKSSKPIPVFKTSLDKAITSAKAISKEDYAAEGVAILQNEIAAAEKVKENEAATQLEVNKQARALRAAIVALVRVKDEQLDTPTPDTTVGPVETPGISENPTVTETPGITENPTITGTPENPSVTGTPAVANTPSVETTVTPGVTPSSQPVSELEISKFTINPSKYQLVNKNIKAKVNATGGKGIYTYRFLVYNDSGILVNSSSYGTEAFYTYKPTKSGNYTIMVVVRDENNGEVEVSKNVTVISKNLSVTLKSSKKSIKKGKVLKFTAKASGGKKGYTYSFVVKNAKGKKIDSSESTKKNSWSWKAKKAGTYKVTVTVKDSLGLKATKTVTKIKVKK
ncbi:MAG: starch-binding protein, partial [Lachnospiraceae bacterium]|nr:starch-binding protein [Lachnospiraceae bacterium]